MLIADDCEDFKDGNCDDLGKCKNEIAVEQISARRRKLLKELMLAFLAFALLTNNFIHCATLVPVTPTSNKLTPEATIFFVTKDMASLIAAPFVALVVDHMGNDIPLLFGSIVMFLSTALLACGEKQLLFFVVSILHGLGFACVEISTFSIVTHLFSTTIGRIKGFGVILQVASFGTYSEGLKLIDFLLCKLDQTLFLILAFIPFVNGIVLCLTSTRLKREEAKEIQIIKPKPVPMWKLLIDPYIFICIGSLLAANIPLFFFQKTLELWASDDLFSSQNTKTDTAWFLLFSHILGVTFVIVIVAKYNSCGWLMALSGLLLGGLCCVTAPLIDSYEIMEIFACGVAFGVGMVRAAVLTTLACIMEIRHVPVFGSVYAVASMLSSMGYISSVLVTYLDLPTIGFTRLILAMGISNILYSSLFLQVRRL